MLQCRVDVGDQHFEQVRFAVQRPQVQRGLPAAVGCALPTAASSSGRLVMASILAFELAARQYQLQQL
jgi:hypothetical protein